MDENDMTEIDAMREYCQSLWDQALVATRAGRYDEAASLAGSAREVGNEIYRIEDFGEAEL